MKIITHQCKAFAAIAAVSLLMASFPCYSQPLLHPDAGGGLLIAQNAEPDKGIVGPKQTTETGVQPSTSTGPATGDTLKGTKDEKVIKANALPANKENQIEAIDSTKYNIFGNLLNDDPAYNKRYPWWRPIGSILEAQILLVLYNRYGQNADYGRVGFRSWGHNIKTGWEWDTDRFGMNFFAHPYSGALSFMAARANGYSFWKCLPYALGGSFMWEYFGENTLPSYNDVINTPVSGVFMGEIMYRIGSNILDDRTTGQERFYRELGAAIFSPTRFVNRVLQGKNRRITSKEVYQKEPLNIELSTGTRRLNDANHFATGPGNIFLNFQLDYGYPFEKRSWKPYDYFKIRADANFGVGRKILDNVTGYGVLFGKTVQTGKLEMLIGGFQHYNFFDNATYELGAISLGGGVMSKLTISPQTYLFTNYHLGIVPLAGNSTRLGPDTSQLRDYIYGGGLETKLESGLDLGWASAQFIGYLFWIRTYVGTPGSNIIGIVRPRVTVKIIKNLYLGFEHLIYYTDRSSNTFTDLRSVRTEQKVYLMLNVGNFKL